MSEYLSALRHHSWRRVDTDYIMPIWLPFLPSVLVLVGMLALIPAILMWRRAPLGFLGGISALIGLTALGMVIGIYVIYKWIKRRNDHFSRQIMLMRSVIGVLRELSRMRGGVADAEIALLERDLREAELEEVEKSAILWVILTLVIGIIWYYVAHFLNEDFHKHEVREDRMISSINRALEALGLPRVEFYRTYSIPARNTILYIILTLVTMGIFGLYWMYTLTKDPNEHFIAHSIWEGQLVGILERAPL